MSANPRLRRLGCRSNELAQLDVSANAALETLSCQENKLTALDVSANTALYILYRDKSVQVTGFGEQPEETEPDDL